MAVALFVTPSIFLQFSIAKFVDDRLLKIKSSVLFSTLSSSFVQPSAVILSVSKLRCEIDKRPLPAVPDQFHSVDGKALIKSPKIIGRQYL